MIAKLKGTIDYLRAGYAVLDVGGVGYKVFVTSYAIGKIARKKEAELYIHTYVRQDSIDLFGFLALGELEMFELLISISGVGPKAGLGILSIADPKTIRTAIINKDPSILTRVSGVGKRTAERIILELQNKVQELSDVEKAAAVVDKDAIEALIAMGYSVSEARDALKAVPANVKNEGERIKTALKNLGKP